MDYIKQIYRNISSMKAGLILLGIIGLMSGFGSVLFPRNFFQTVHFKLLLLLLLLNMLFCTFNQLVRYLRNDQGNPFRLTFRKLALLILHLGVVLILLGGTAQVMYGERIKTGIMEGETVGVTWQDQSLNPFSIRLDQFSIEYNPDGSASQYYSQLSIFKGKDKVKEQVISINHPLKHEGVKVYLTNFGHSVVIVGQSTAGWRNQDTLFEGETFELSGTDKKIKIVKYIPNYDPKYGLRSKTLRPDNPRIIYNIISRNENTKAEVASLDEKILITPEVSIRFDRLHPYAIFIVKTDPGLPLAAVGGLLLMIGSSMALFVAPKNKKSKPATVE